MDFRHLTYFLAIVDHGGFNRAAAALYVSQPSLSQAIRVLERDAGSSLFHRIGRRAVLTEAGAALVPLAREALRALELARAGVGAVRELRGGRLEIAAMASPAVEPLGTMVRRFTERHPAVTLSLRVALTREDVVEMVRTGRCELGLLTTSSPLPDSDVVRHPAGSQRLVLVAPKAGPFKAGRAVRREQLAGQRLIVGQRGTGIRAYVDDLKARGVDVHIAVETEHRIAFLPLVLGGVGLAVVTESWADLSTRAGALVLDPTRFDVVVASNLFGDILSDLAAAVAGGIGIAPSANLNPEGEYPSMFEPVHGSAPDIAGQGVANPIGAIWSGAMMLDHLGHPRAAADITDAIARVLATTLVRTRDLGGSASTAEFTAAVLREF
ncbi:isocitrate/isopropylmalate family dehydrogenase [Streptomyces sp. NPDC001717]|uniref:isocitrate/isopropylmalate family dehydrogenase n=1 Tax=Streptomyces sp. NPDC001717 TaxID=3364604 RepID=UPI00368908C0